MYKIDATLARLTFASFFSYFIFYKLQDNFIIIAYSLSIGVLGIAFYLGDYFSNKERLSDLHLLSHGLSDL